MDVLHGRHVAQGHRSRIVACLLKNCCLRLVYTYSLIQIGEILDTNWGNVRWIPN